MIELKNIKDLFLYHIHGLINVVSNYDVDVISKYFRQAISAERAKELMKNDEVDLILTVKKALDISTKRYGSSKFSPLINEDGIAIRVKRFSLNICAKLTNPLIKGTKFYVSNWWLRIPILKQMVTDTILQLLHLKLLMLHKSMFHAACLHLNKKTIVLAGGFGAGKTLSTLQLVTEAGAQYLTDDIIICDVDGTAYCYPLKIALYPYHFRICKKLEKPGLIHSLKIYLRGFAHSLIPLETGIQIVDPFLGEKEIFEVYPDVKIRPNARITHFFLLEEGEPNIERVNNEGMFQKTYYTNKKVFAFEINPFVLAFSYFFPKKLNVFDVVEKEKEIVKRLLENVETKGVIQSYGERHAQVIKQLLMER